MKRVAICISGSPRSWVKCLKETLNFLYDFSTTILADSCTFDCFVHTWDFNTVPGNVSERFSVPEEELNRFLECISPKKFLIESQDKSEEACQCVDRFLPRYGWLGSQFYGIEQACKLKQEYEQECGFTYDLVFRIRPDLKLFNANIRPIQLSVDTLYGHILIYNVTNETFPSHYGVSDFFFFGHSKVYDIAAGLYSSISEMSEGERSWINNDEKIGCYSEFLIQYNTTRSGKLVCPIPGFWWEEELVRTNFTVNEKTMHIV